MTMSRRVRAGLSIWAVATTALATLFGFSAPNAQAFFIQNHEMITRNALPADQVTSDAMLQILVGPPPGGGAVEAMLSRPTTGDILTTQLLQQTSVPVRARRGIPSHRSC